MADLDLETELTKIEKKFAKEGREDEIKEIRSLDSPQLDAKLLALAKGREEILTAQGEDSDLRDAKKHSRFLGKTYRDQLKFNALKARFIELFRKDQGLS